MELQTAVDDAVEDLKIRAAHIDEDGRITPNGFEHEELNSPIHPEYEGKWLPLTPPRRPSVSQGFDRFVQCHQHICTGIAVWR